MRQQRAGAEGQDYRVKIGTDGFKVTEVSKGAGGLSGSEVEALQAQVAVLRDRVERLREERTELSEQASAGALTGPLVQPTAERLTLLTQQLGAAEAQLSQVEDKLAEAGVTPQTVTATFEGVPPIPFDPNIQRDIPENVVILAVVSIIFVAMPIAVSIARWVWKRSTGGTVTTKTDAELTQRLARMEQSVDSIAVELERVSEGQRFVTRILSEQRGLGAGAAEPVPLPVGEKVQAR